jgi:signal transduction histidine kinase
MAGESPASIPFGGEQAYVNLYDWRELNRWGLNESALPADAKIVNKPFSAWERYRPYIIGAVAFILLETALIIFLIVQRRRTKRAVQALRESETALTNSHEDVRRLAGRLISAQEEELRRLSRELHDDLTQRLAVLAIDAGKLELDLNKMSDAYPGTSQKISQMKDELIKVSEDVHHISRQIHPSILDDLGLVRALESEFALLMKREKLRIRFNQENVPAVIPNEVALCLYRIVQEGLKNITKHSGAGSADIFLTGDDSAVSVTVVDAGVGFDPLRAKSKPGLGLASMRERASLVNGDFSVESQPGQGTMITVRVPLTGSGT